MDTGIDMYVIDIYGQGIAREKRGGLYCCVLLGLGLGSGEEKGQSGRRGQGGRRKCIAGFC